MKNHMNKKNLRDHETEIAIAAAVLIGAGICVAMMMRPKRHPLRTKMMNARNDLMDAGEEGIKRVRGAGKKAVKKARKGLDHGMDLLEDLPIDDIGDQLQDYLESAKQAIEDTISGELKDLQRSIRRRRRRMGV